jgi:hypothetical protein
MIRFRSTLPAEVIAHHLAAVVYPDVAVPAGLVAAHDIFDAPYWRLSECDRHQLIPGRGAGEGLFELFDLYECPDRRARFLAVLAELGAEVVI